MSYEVTTEPLAEVLTAAEIAPHTVVDDPTDQAYIDQFLIPAARQYLERKYDKAIGLQTVREDFSGWPEDGCLVLTVSPSDVVVSVQYHDEDDNIQTLADTAYWTKFTGLQGFVIIKPDATLPSLKVGRPNAVQVTYTAGSPVAMPIKLAIMELVADYNLNREAYREGLDAAIASFYTHADDLIHPFRVYRV